MVVYWAVIGILAVLLIILWLRLRRFARNFNQRLEQAVKPYQEQIKDLQAEVKRLKFVLEECKNNKNHHDTLTEITSEDQQIDLRQLIAEKQKLEKEKQSLKEKTKKLWEQSLAIHREKDRIDRLRREIEARHKEITDSINYASRIQTALLPDEQELSKIFKEFFVLWKPKQIVSGDFYWVHKYENRIFAVAADCTGHGVPGAFMSLLGISFLNQIVNANPLLQPHQILEKLRAYVIKALGEKQAEGEQPKDGMDMALVIIHTDTGLLEYAGANNPVYIIRGQELIELKPVRSPIGYYLVTRNFEKRDFLLKPGDKIYMFSDGFADQFGGDEEKKVKFTRKRFKQLLLKVNEEGIPFPEQKDVLWEVFEKWRGNQRQIDDVLVFGIHWI